MIEWNGRPLQGIGYQEVADIIAESKHEPDIELIVSRAMGSKRSAQSTWKESAAHRGTTPEQYSTPHICTHTYTPRTLRARARLVDDEVLSVYVWEQQLYFVSTTRSLDSVL